VSDFAKDVPLPVNNEIVPSNFYEEDGILYFYKDGKKWVGGVYENGCRWYGELDDQGFVNKYFRS
jgi:hypothetical protein